MYSERPRSTSSRSKDCLYAHAEAEVATKEAEEAEAATTEAKVHEEKEQAKVEITAEEVALTEEAASVEEAKPAPVEEPTPGECEGHRSQVGFTSPDSMSHSTATGRRGPAWRARCESPENRKIYGRDILGEIESMVATSMSPRQVEEGMSQERRLSVSPGKKKELVWKVSAP